MKPLTKVCKWKAQKYAVHAHHVVLFIGLDLDKNTMADVYAKFGLESATQQFIGKYCVTQTDILSN